MLVNKGGLLIWFWICKIFWFCVAIFLQPKFYWHIHHRQLLEIALEPIKDRREYIQTQKPEKEIQRRLRLLKKVKGRLPFRLRSLGFLYHHCRPNYWHYASGDLGKMLVTYSEVIDALHKKECPECPWDGKTIFPEHSYD
jgi:hypothetical protein